MPCSGQWCYAWQHRYWHFFGGEVVTSRKRRPLAIGSLLQDPLSQRRDSTKPAPSIAVPKIAEERGWPLPIAEHAYPNEDK
jgi:hypothetical protein